MWVCRNGEMNPMNKRLWNISSNPELILFHIMAFHAQAVTTTNESQRIGAGGKRKNCTPWAKKKKEIKKKKVVNDLLHPFKPSFLNWFIFAAVIKNISRHHGTSTIQHSSENNLRNNKRANERQKGYVAGFARCFTWNISLCGIVLGVNYWIKFVD